MSFAGVECVVCRERPSLPRGDRTQSIWPTEEDFVAASLGVSDALVGTTVPACLRCSSALSDRFERAAKPVVEWVWGGGLRLRPAEARTFVAWVLKTWLLSAHPAAQVADPRSSLPRFELSKVPDDIYGWLGEERQPPAGLSLWVTRSGERSAEPEPRYRIPLPTIAADGQTVLFQTFTSRLELDEAGALEIDLVYHPGWEIEHPLEPEGRAVRLWPRDGRRTLDLGALPVLHVREVAWSRGPRLVFAPEAYRGELREPLSALTRLTFFPPFPVGVTAITAVDG